MRDNRGGFWNTLGSLIPGYKGYQAKEARRDTDRALRAAIVTRLMDRKPDVERLITDASRQMKFDVLEPLELLNRRLTTLADRIRHAPGGYSGLFDRVQIDPDELNVLYQADMKVQQHADEAVGAIAQVSIGDASSIDRAVAAVQQAEEAFRQRDHAVTGQA